MTIPDDLPGMLEYRMGTHKGVESVRVALPRRPVLYVSSSGSTNAAQICPRIPYGCTGWRRVGESAWRALKDLPIAWMPFLNRARGTSLDPRPEKEIA